MKDLLHEDYVAIWLSSLNRFADAPAGARTIAPGVKVVRRPDPPSLIACRFSVRRRRVNWPGLRLRRSRSCSSSASACRLLSSMPTASQGWDWPRRSASPSSSLVVSVPERDSVGQSRVRREV